VMVSMMMSTVMPPCFGWSGKDDEYQPNGAMPIHDTTKSLCAVLR
jgi:hypothetical protein